jgi:hypothetical protein
MPTPKTAILLIDCPDRKGIVVTIVNFLVQTYDINTPQRRSVPGRRAWSLLHALRVPSEAECPNQHTFRVAVDQTASRRCWYHAATTSGGTLCERRWREVSQMWLNADPGRQARLEFLDWNDRNEQGHADVPELRQQVLAWRRYLKRI